MHLQVPPETARRTRGARVLACLLLALGAAAGTASAGEEPAAPPDVEDLVAWFGGLRSYERPGDRPWVRVLTGAWSRTGDEAPHQEALLAFLVSEEGDAFTVLFTDLSGGRYERTPDGTPGHRRVGFERVDPEAEADALLAALRAPPPEEEDAWRRFGARVTEATEVFVVAAACHARGLADRARDLVLEADRLARREPRRGASLREALETDLAHARTWRLVVAFGEDDFAIGDPPGPGLRPRRDLLADWWDLRADFPSNPHAELVAETIALLERMVAEDEERARQPARAWESLTPDERAETLVFALRDQNGRQWGQPGWCDVFADPRGEESPAARLVALGFDAVPRLLDALSDRRFTRSVGFHRNFYFSHRVLRVGDVVEAVLSRIAGRSFWEPRTTSSTVGSDDETRAVEAAARAWWAEVQAKGEVAVLTEAVRRGGRNALPQAERLLQRAPEEAVAALAEGLRRTDETWARAGLVDVLGRAEGEAAVAALLEILRTDPSLGCRVAAARALFRRERPEAVAAMLEAWRAPSAAGSEDPSPLVEFLVGCRDVAAIAALAEGLDGRPLAVRRDVIWSLGEPGGASLLATGPAAEGGRAAGQGAAGSPEWETAVEDLLAGRLADLGRIEGLSGSWQGKDFADPRIADLAGHVLATRWPDRYRFDLSASEGTRDRQRRLALNAWRAARGQPPLPVPEPAVVARTPGADLAPLLDAALGADSEARDRAEGALAALGLAALPGLLERALALPEDHPRRAPLLALASRLGALVVAVEVSGPAPEPGSPLARAVDALRGAALTADGVVAVLVEAARALPAGSRGLRFAALREADLTGIRVALAFEPGEPEEHGNGPGFEHAARIQAGRLALEGAYGSSVLEHLREASGWESTARAVTKALALPPDRSLLVRISILRTRAER